MKKWKEVGGEGVRRGGKKKKDNGEKWRNGRWRQGMWSGSLRKNKSEGKWMKWKVE